MSDSDLGHDGQGDGVDDVLDHRRVGLWMGWVRDCMGKWLRGIAFMMYCVSGRKGEMSLVEPPRLHRREKRCGRTLN